ncbi:hypothetical protein GE09DRAFT_1175738 [Coniochaeta sp. 2T2.1]|nr:hypothetical protein GE09DRAFT_1175738 [Coniochaeta sp. 2T2.1]
MERGPSPEEEKRLKGHADPAHENKQLQQGSDHVDEEAPDSLRNNDSNKLLGDINWFWLSQTDIIPGFWATPWHRSQALNIEICVGAINVITEAIQSIVGTAGLINYRYPPEPCSPANSKLSKTIDWMNSGKSTYPAYAYNGQGGIVCHGAFTDLTGSDSLFATPIDAIEVLNTRAAADCIESSLPRCQQDVERCIIELMRLDAWLCKVGSMPEIRDGRSALLTQTPALVQELMDRFEPSFMEADMSSAEGGAQLNKDLAQTVVEWLTQSHKLTRAEALYALVAVLRTVKVGQCVLGGPDTSLLAEIMEKDVQVCLV